MFNTRLTCAIASAVALCLASAATAQVDVAIHYLKQVVDAPPTLSNLDPIPEDLGIRGAELGAQENNTTGKFLGQTYSLIVTEVFEGEDFAEAARAAAALKVPA